MASAKLRPTFTIGLPLPAPEAMARIRLALQSERLVRSSSSAGTTAEFFVPREQRRMWSPHLSIQVEAEGHESVLRGRYSPRPDIWTMVMFCYFLFAFVALFGAALGYVQWASGDTAWGLAAALLGLAAMGGLHLMSMIGQRLGADQMKELRAHLEEVVAQAFDGTRVPDLYHSDDG